MRKLKAATHKLLNSKFLRYPTLMHPLFYPPQYPKRRLENSCSLSDDLLQRICVAFQRANAAASDDIWSELQKHSEGLRQALKSGNLASLRTQLSDLFGVESALTGMAHSARFFHAKGSYGSDFLSIRCRDALLSVAEATGARPVRSNLQTSLRDYRLAVNEPLDVLLADVERKLGHSLAPPALGGPPVIVCGERYLNPDSIRHSYAAYRIEQLGAPKDKPVLEIGGGFATLARYALLRGYKDYTIIDLPFVSAVQAAFVADSFGEDSVCLYGEDRPARMRLIPSTDKAALAKSYNLVVNIDSLPEIGEAPEYLSMIAKTTPLFLSINQESSNARTGFTQNVVSEMCDAHGAFQRRSRHIYWMEQGYVEEVYAVGGAEI